MVMLCQDAGKSISLTWTLIDAYHILASRLIDIWNLEGTPPVVFFNFRLKIPTAVMLSYKKTNQWQKKCALMMQLRWSQEAHKYVELKFSSRNLESKFIHTKCWNFSFVCASCPGTNWTSYTSNINRISSVQCASDGSWSPKCITFSLWPEQCGT